MNNNIPSQGFRHQSVKLWNSNTSVDMRKAKLTTQQLREHIQYRTLKLYNFIDIDHNYYYKQSE
jgi:hypothetical protein